MAEQKKPTKRSTAGSSAGRGKTATGDAGPENLEPMKNAATSETVIGGGNGNDNGDTGITINVEQSGSPEPSPTDDIALWKLLKFRAVDFEKYRKFIDDLFCPHVSETGDPRMRRITSRFSLQRTDAYDGIKAATDQFLLLQCAVLDDVPVLEAFQLTPPELRDLPGIYDGALNRPLDQHFEQRLRILGSRASDTVDAKSEDADLKRALPEEELGRFVDHYLESVNLAGEGTKELPALPYLKIIREKLQDVVLQDCKKDPSWARYAAACSHNGLLCSRVVSPCMIELIWSYWMEQGMLVQSINAIALRFQNRRSKSLRDPLANLTLDPLRPLNNLIWGFIQDERNRLTVTRRAHEYDHEYGLKLVGKAVGNLNTVDSRSTFLEAFHTLLHLAAQFYKQDDDKNVRADPFPLLNGLRDLHMVLAQGAHNQFGDLPWVARVEMMVMQYLLARPEMREFFGSRIMVPYKEPWMDRVDAMKKLQGWTDTSITHFHDLAANGEQLLLSVRYGNWNNATPDQAFHWARAWRAEIQRYVYAYRTVTGEDLAGVSADKIKVSTVQPTELIQRRGGSAKQTKSA